MAPPGFRSSPSSVTIRSVCLYFAASFTALSTLSATTIRPSREAATSRYLSSSRTRVSAVPITPFSASTSGFLNLCGFLMLVSGRKVALPSLFDFSQDIICLAVSSLSVTIFWIFPPRAVSMAVSYFLSVCMISATTPMMPGFFSRCSMTFLMLPP